MNSKYCVVCQSELFGHALLGLVEVGELLEVSMPSVIISGSIMAMRQMVSFAPHVDLQGRCSRSKPHQHLFLITQL
jgi:hypothetical protein